MGFEPTTFCMASSFWVRAEFKRVPREPLVKPRLHQVKLTPLHSVCGSGVPQMYLAPKGGGCYQIGNRNWRRKPRRSPTTPPKEPASPGSRITRRERRRCSAGIVAAQVRALDTIEHEMSAGDSSSARIGAARAAAHIGSELRNSLAAGGILPGRTVNDLGVGAGNFLTQSRGSTTCLRSGVPASPRRSERRDVVVAGRRRSSSAIASAGSIETPPFSAERQPRAAPSRGRGRADAFPTERTVRAVQRAAPCGRRISACAEASAARRGCPAPRPAGCR